MYSFLKINNSEFSLHESQVPVTFSCLLDDKSSSHRYKKELTMLSKCCSKINTTSSCLFMWDNSWIIRTFSITFIFTSTNLFHYSHRQFNVNKKPRTTLKWDRALDTAFNLFHICYVVIKIRCSRKSERIWRIFHYSDSMWKETIKDKNKVLEIFFVLT